MAQAQPRGMKKRQKVDDGHRGYFGHARHRQKVDDGHRGYFGHARHRQKVDDGHHRGYFGHARHKDVTVQAVDLLDLILGCVFRVGGKVFGGFVRDHVVPRYYPPCSQKLLPHQLDVIKEILSCNSIVMSQVQDVAQLIALYTETHEFITSLDFKDLDVKFGSRHQLLQCIQELHKLGLQCSQLGDMIGQFSVLDFVPKSRHHMPPHTTRNLDECYLEAEVDPSSLGTFETADLECVLNRQATSAMAHKRYPFSRLQLAVYHPTVADEKQPLFLSVDFTWSLPGKESDLYVPGLDYICNSLQIDSMMNIEVIPTCFDITEDDYIPTTAEVLDQIHKKKAMCTKWQVVCNRVAEGETTAKLNRLVVQLGYTVIDVPPSVVVPAL